MKRLTTLFLVDGGKVLLAMKKRGFGVGRWNGVGGKVEAGETWEQAVARECQEEIGVIPTTVHKMAEIIFDELHSGKREKLQVHVFISRRWQGEPIETEEMAPRWFDISALPLHDMWADNPYWLPQVLNGKSLQAEFTLDDQDQVIKKQVTEVSTAW